MAIGGFNGTDPSPTLAQFQAYVAQHKIHYFIGGGGFGGRAASAAVRRARRRTSAITQWVASNFTAQTVGGVTVYDLTPGSVSRATVPPPARGNELDRAAVQLGDLLDDREPETGARHRPRASGAR